MKQEINKGIIVKGGNLDRHYHLSISNSQIPNSQYLRNYSLPSTREVTYELHKLMTGVVSEYEWGEEQIFITSNKETSRLEDLMWGEQLPVIPTVWLLGLMEAWAAFQEEYSDREKIKGIIGKAFLLIRKNPVQHRMSETGEYYQVVVDGTHLALQLNENDLKLDISEYASQLKQNNF